MLGAWKLPSPEVSPRAVLVSLVPEEGSHQAVPPLLHILSFLAVLDHLWPTPKKMGNEKEDIFSQMPRSMINCPWLEYRDRNKSEDGWEGLEPGVGPDKTELATQSHLQTPPWV